MTKFYIKDERLGDMTFHSVTRQLYKKIITITDRLGGMFRVETMYVGVIPVKKLTLLKRIEHE